MAQHPIARLDEIDELADLNYRYRPVRHHFGISSLGVAAWTARETGDAIVGGYDEDSETNEELFVVVSGCAVFHIDGESVEAPAGALVYTPPGRTAPRSRRSQARRSLPSAGRRERHTTRRGGSCGPPGAAHESGQHAELASRLKAVIAANPQYPMLVYNLAPHPRRTGLFGTDLGPCLTRVLPRDGA